MRFPLVGLAVHNPDATPVGFPARNAGAEVLVGVCDAFVVFLFKLVFVGIWIRVAPAPKFLDEAFALVVSSQFLECLAFFVGNDVSDVFVEPVFVGLFEFRLNIARLCARILRRLREHRRTGAEKQAH